jgi:pimeloyl-ACP methyl ester carboxylesterase
MTRTGRLSVPGADLYFEVEGVGPAVVLVHGFSLDARMWDDQVPALRDVATVIRYDVRGFGRSSMPEPGVLYAQSTDLVALLDHLGVANAVLVGLSMGGLIVLHTALVAPSRVHGLVLLDSLLDEVEWDAESDIAFEQAATVAVNEGAEAAKAVWLQHPLFAAARRDPDLAARLAREVEPYSCFHWTQTDPRAPLEPSPYAALEQIAAPTTVVIGERDVACFHEMAELLARRIPGARLITVPGAGHMVNLEAPAMVNALLRDAVTAR